MEATAVQEAKYIGCLRLQPFYTLLTINRYLSGIGFLDSSIVRENKRILYAEYNLRWPCDFFASSSVSVTMLMFSDFEIKVPRQSRTMDLVIFWVAPDSVWSLG